MDEHAAHYSVSTPWQKAAQEGCPQRAPEGSCEQHVFPTIHIGGLPDKLLCTSSGLVCFKEPQEGPDAGGSCLPEAEKNRGFKEEVMLFFLT